MSYVGEETIELSEDTTPDDICKRIEKWQLSETGSWYEVKEEDTDHIVLERTWRSSGQYIVLCAIILAFGFIPAALEQTHLSLRFAAILVMNYILFGLSIVWWVLKIQEFVQLVVRIRGDSVKIEAEGTNRRKTEANLDSIIRSIRGS